MSKLPENKEKNSKSVDFDNLYLDNIDDLYAYAISLGFNRQIAMDAIHDVFYKIYSNSEQLDNINNIKFFLLRSLKNKLIDFVRTEKEAKKLPIDTISELPFNVTFTVEDSLIQTEDEERIKAKINNVLSILTDRQREIIYLKFIMEYNYEEIAELMKITVPSCRKLIYKTIKTLRENQVPLIIFLRFITWNIS